MSLKKTNKYENLVKYKNPMNKVITSDFRAKELDIFITACFLARDMESNEIKISFDELKKLAGYSGISENIMARDLRSTFVKLSSLSIHESYSDGSQKGFALFTNYFIDRANRELTYKVNEEYLHLLNDWSKGGFTYFELSEYIQLKSIYSKRLYIHMKQFKTTGRITMRYDDFRILMGVPQGYTVSEVDRRALNPAIEELTPIFGPIRVEKHKGQYGKIMRITITFMRETTNTKELEKERQHKEYLELIEYMKANGGRR